MTNAMASPALCRFILKVRPGWLGAKLKRLFNIQRIEITTDQGSFWIDPASNFGSRLREDPIYEQEMFAALTSRLQPGDTFADIGANEGYYSVVAGRIVGPTGAILAFEPQSRLHPILERNFTLNHLASARVVRSAVGSAESTAELNLFPDINTGATSFNQNVAYRLPTETVRVARLDDLLRESGTDAIGVAKVDVEGFEVDVLRGAEPLLAAHKIRSLVIEVHPPLLAQMGQSVEDIRALGERHGYRFTELNPELVTLDL